jgi:uncharacterized membrane protein YgcG
MKTQNFKIPLMTLAAVTGLVLLAGDTVAQDATVVSQPAATVQSAPRLAYSTAEIVTMVQAKIGESTILAYIQNSSMIFPLNAAQIIYLKQQGASNAILDAMLNHQPAASAAPAAQDSTAAAQTSTAAVAQTSTAVAQPTVTYVQTPSPSPVYAAPYPYYYPYYGYYPYSPVVFSFGWGGGWGGGWRGGGGWHGGGGWGGGWHGGGGGGWHR